MQSASENTLDIIFISYNESNADMNWLNLKSRFPRARRVHGIKGIREAHEKAATKSTTDFFFVVDGDNKIVSDFKFEKPELSLKKDTIYVYRCRNPLNGLIYGYGAVKIYNKEMLSGEFKGQYRDFAMTVSSHYQIIDEVASETHFHSSAEEAWRGAFRECFKLATELRNNPTAVATEERLKQWCEMDSRQPFSDWALLGARQGRDYARSQNQEKVLINDFQWLKQFFIDHVEH